MAARRDESREPISDLVVNYCSWSQVAGGEQETGDSTLVGTFLS